MCMASENCKLQERVDAIDNRVTRLEENMATGFTTVTTAVNSTNTAVNQLAADFGKIFVGAEAAVDFSEISGIIAVAVRFKDRGKIECIAADRSDVLRPCADFAHAVDGFAVIFPRCTTKSHRINLIKNALICPHNER